MIWVWIGVYLLLSTGSVAGWYLWNRRANRNRAVQVLHWLERALGGQGHVTGIRWVSSSEFEVPVRLSSQVFRKPKFLVKFAPREFPLQWLVSRLRKQAAETVTFLSDLDLQPRFSIEMQSLRWFARSRPDLCTSKGAWDLCAAEPLVVTTRLDWEKEVSAVLHSLAECEQKENLNLSFRKTSPHFSATLPLENLETEGDEKSPFFASIRSIAEGAAISH